MVVAQEVRQLAQRASHAAREIDEQIQQSGKDVAKGVEMVQSTGEVLRRIVEAIVTVESAAEKITDSSHDQDNSIREVSKAMQDLDRITQTNAGAAEETAAAVNRLNAMVADLETQLTFFRNEDGSLKSGLSLARPQPTSSRVDGKSEDRRKEPHVGASIPSVTEAPSFAAQWAVVRRGSLVRNQSDVLAARRAVSMPLTTGTLHPPTAAKRGHDMSTQMKGTARSCSLVKSNTAAQTPRVQHGPQDCARGGAETRPLPARGPRIVRL
jgi:hypothetical protein